MGSSLNIRNMHWTVGMRELIFDEQVMSNKERALLASQKLRDLMSDKDWLAWLDAAPDANNEYLEAVEAKLSDVLGGARAPLSMTTSIAQTGGK